MKRLKEIFKDESGQGMLEYVLLLAIVAGLVMVFKKQLLDIFNTATGKLNSSTQAVFQDQ